MDPKPGQALRSTLTRKKCQVNKFAFLSPLSWVPFQEAFVPRAAQSSQDTLTLAWLFPSTPYAVPTAHGGPSWPCFSRLSLYPWKFLSPTSSTRKSRLFAFQHDIIENICARNYEILSPLQQVF